MITILKIFFLLSSATQLQKADTINFEQIAFDNFISQVDSIIMHDYSGTKYFQKHKHNIYFSGETGFYSAMPFALNSKSLKRDFIIIDSANDLQVGKESWIYPLKGTKKIKFKAKFIVIDNQNKPNKPCKPGDLRIFMSNRYFHNGFYYVKFYFSSDTQIKSELYIKIDQNGNVVDRLETTFML